MIRLLNVLALVALIASATSAYTVKYETILVAEKLRKREAELQRERDAIAILKAEWQLLNRPQRMQALAAPLGAMQPLSMRQIVRPTDIPQRGPEDDKIEDLLTGSIPTTDSKAKSAARAPVTPRPAAKTGDTTAAARATTPVRSTTPARPAANPKANAAATPRPGAPVRLTPPANVAPTQTARVSAPAATPPAQSSPSLLDRIRNALR